MFTESGLAGKVAIVTGGSRGIGRAITQLLAEEAMHVVFFYHKSYEHAKKFQNESHLQGLKVSCVSVDVCHHRQCEEAVHMIYDKYGKIDVLVNNSGITRDNLLVNLTDEDIRTVMDTNLMGVFHMTQIVAPFMINQRSGKIINISSVSGERGGRGQSNYAASKGAINAFTKAMAVELAPRKITVNSVAPGVIETDMTKTILALGGDEALDKILLKRYGKPEEVAFVVAFLASKYGEYITGQIIHVDGGFKMA